jgi:hypothetical protein
MAYIPEIVIHEVVAGNTFNGAATNGIFGTITQGAPYWNGRVNFYGQGTAGGLLTSPADIGTYVTQIMFRGEGTTGFSLAIRSDLWPAPAPVSFDFNLFDDTSLIDVQGKILSDVESFVYAPNSGIFVPPSHSLVFTTTGTLTSDSRVMFFVGGSWGYRTLQNIYS